LNAFSSPMVETVSPLRRVDQRLVGELEQSSEQRLILRTRIAVLKVGAARAADQQRIAREHPVAHQEAVGIVGVTGRIEDVERYSFDRELVAVSKPHGHNVDAAVLSHHRDALRAVAQRAKSGDVVGMQVCVDRLDQLEVELLHELQVAVNLLQHRIDNQCFAAATAREQIGIGARYAVEQLAEDHGSLQAINPTQL
jgi:hypothetical protein